MSDLELESDEAQTPIMESQPLRLQSPQPDFMKLSPLEQKHFMVQLTNLFWQLLAARPANQMIAPACMPGEPLA